jgi:membrane dipeptidase
MPAAGRDLPVIDLHCDLLAYLAAHEGADPAAANDIGCALPHLVAGRVKLQVTAVYTGVEPGSVLASERQVAALARLLRTHGNRLTAPATADEIRALLATDRIGLVLALENASSICEEDEPLADGLLRLDRILATAGRILYVSLTHFGENRFGGGNTTGVGLKDDGRRLLDHLDGRGVAVDLSHTSDALARGILDHLDRAGLRIPVLASHSNFRSVWDHPRNLPDELAVEIVRRGGLIGLCLMREYLDLERPGRLAEHAAQGIALGAERALAFGADYFCIHDHPDRSRLPFFHPEHEDAGRYPALLAGLDGVLDAEQLRGLSHRNALEFIARSWGEPGAADQGS